MHDATSRPKRMLYSYEARCRDELRRRKFALASARWELAHALFWRWMRLALTLGRWRR